MSTDTGSNKSFLHLVYQDQEINFSNEGSKPACDQDKEEEKKSVMKVESHDVAGNETEFDYHDSGKETQRRHFTNKTGSDIGSNKPFVDEDQEADGDTEQSELLVDQDKQSEIKDESNDFAGAGLETESDDHDSHQRMQMRHFENKTSSNIFFQ